jgi:DNA replication protein DnaC
MTAFLKIDACKTCRRALPWEWVPAVVTAGKLLAGTGVWRTQLTGGLCPACLAALEAEREKTEHARARRSELVRLLGGEKPFREFTFERYRVTPDNRLAYEYAESFDPAVDNLYLWGPCGVGKTHLATAAARRCFDETLSVQILRPWQLSRKVRLKEPAEAQAAIDEIVRADTLVLDDLGAGADTPFLRQVIQEILDGREFSDRAGLLITSKYSFGDLAYKIDDDAIASRLAGLCRPVEIQGEDVRLQKRTVLP